MRGCKRGCKEALSMLNRSAFYRNFIDKYINRKAFRLIPIDVDSIYMVLYEE